MSGEPEAMGDAVAHEPARVCASCGAALTPGLRFCASCGNWIGADEPVVDETPVVVDEPPVLADEEPAAVDEDPAAGAEPIDEHPVREVPALAVHEPSLAEL